LHGESMTCVSRRLGSKVARGLRHGGNGPFFTLLLQLTQDNHILRLHSPK
jgi:hypothetical protein